MASWRQAKGAAVSTGTATETRTDTEQVPQTSHGSGDHDRFAHYVLKDKIVESAVTGNPVMALCGKVWVPGRDPKKFPLCPECKRLYDLGPEGRIREWAERARQEGVGS
jgi:hypothetical protein